MTGARRMPDVDDLRLLPVALAAWAGAWWGTGGGRAPLVLIIVALLIAALALARLISKRPGPAPLHARSPRGSLGAGLLVVALALAVAAGIGGAHRRAFDASEAVRAARSGALVSVTARLEEDPVPVKARSGVSRSRARAQVLETGQGGPAGVYVRIVVMGGLADARRGDTVEARGVLDPSYPQGPPTAGLLKDERVAITARPGGWRGSVRHLRERLVEACADLEEQGRALVPGMAIGDDRAMGPELRKAFRTASLTHLTAVSGSHLAIVLGVAPYLLPRSRRGRILGMGALLVVFVAIVGPTPAVLRAALSSGSALLGALIGRNGQGAATLGAVVTGMLLIDPWCSRDFGFALSVAATFGVLIPARAWLRSGRKRLRDDVPLGRVLARLLALIAVPAWCAIMTSPILLAMNPELPAYAVPANLVAAPAVAPATLLALGSALLAPLWMPGAVLLARASSVCTAWIAATARSVADLPGARFEASGARLVLLGALAVLFAFLLVRRRGRARASTKKGLGAPRHALSASWRPSSGRRRRRDPCAPIRSALPHPRPRSPRSRGRPNAPRRSSRPLNRRSHRRRPH